MMFTNCYECHECGLPTHHKDLWAVEICETRVNKRGRKYQVGMGWTLACSRCANRMLYAAAVRSTIDKGRRVLDWGSLHLCFTGYAWNLETDIQIDHTYGKWFRFELQYPSAVNKALGELAKRVEEDDYARLMGPN